VKIPVGIIFNPCVLSGLAAEEPWSAGKKEKRAQKGSALPDLYILPDCAQEVLGKKGKRGGNVDLSHRFATPSFCKE